ncbi:anaphase-promoting complex subunit 5 [Lingula anatina]|uniref:Anaphase-promoting complex subunit 5 n=1 Tax=Lingula anatina TaxID=7574 RepID=A0A1S3I832_LINAN|nr:anaphase-promoting complex subunit 5 [Lingula anatina]|eukprot:XP_013393534.1 anaphase-promoting complex subunit 5 [Lingula anatina]
MADISNLGRFNGQKPLKEYVTPYKIVLLVLVREYRTFKDNSENSLADAVDAMQWIFTEEDRKDFMTMLISLLQAPDMELREVVLKVQEIQRPKYLEVFLKRLEYLATNGIMALMDYFKALSEMFEESEDQPGKFLVSKSSVIGLFIRRMGLAFDKLSFNMVTKLCQSYRRYFRAYNKDQENGDVPLELGLEASHKQQAQVYESDGGILGCNTYSQRQAEYFISQQVNLLHHNATEALPPPKLQSTVSQLLRSMPHLAEAHFLSYLNNLRVDEYCGAIHSLYHYFDRHALASVLTSAASKDEKLDECNKRFRYAALNLAALHYRFGHRKEALAALQEAIRMAHETNDNVCLQHALGWLYRLGEQYTANTADLMFRAVAKSEDLHLHYLASLGVQAFAQHNSVAAAEPASVFQCLVNSDILNCQHSMVDLMATSFAQKSALWSLYGNRQMSSLTSQLLLNLASSDGGVYHTGEAESLGLCNLATMHAEQGMYDMAFEIISYVKQKFPKPSQHATVWSICEQKIMFDQAVHCGNWQVAMETVNNISAIDSKEGEYRKAVLLKEKGQVEDAFQILHSFLVERKKKLESCSADLYSRVLLALGELYCQTDNPSAAIPHILECVSVAKSHHMLLTLIMAKMHLAFIQFTMNMPAQALRMIEEDLVTVLTHGSVYNKARTQYLYAKCKVAAATQEKDTYQKKTARMSAVLLMNTVIDNLVSIQAHWRTKDAVYYQARLCHELGYTAERNKFALQFRQLDQKYPTVNSLAINVL